MSKELKKIKIEAIALTDSPAVKMSRLKLRKSMQADSLEQVIAKLMEGGLSTIAEVKKELDEEGVAKILEALKVIQQYKNDVPDDLENSLETLIVALQELLPDEGESKEEGEKEEEEKEEEEKEEEEKSDESALDDIEKMDPRVQLRLEKLEKSEDEEEDKMPNVSRMIEAVRKQANVKAAEPGDQMVQDVKRLKKIKQNMIDPGEPTKENPMPKLSAWMRFVDATQNPGKYMIKKSELEKEEELEEIDEDVVEIPKKKSLDSQEGLRIEKVEKAEDDDFAEKFPTLSVAFGMFDELRDEDSL